MLARTRGAAASWQKIRDLSTGHRIVRAMATGGALPPVSVRLPVNAKLKRGQSDYGTWNVRVGIQNDVENWVAAKVARARPAHAISVRTTRASRYQISPEDLCYIFRIGHNDVEFALEAAYALSAMQTEQQRLKANCGARLYSAADGLVAPICVLTEHFFKPRATPCADSPESSARAGEWVVGKHVEQLASDLEDNRTGNNNSTDPNYNSTRSAGL
eukprot:2564894-Rhodomonas_salina.1